MRELLDIVFDSIAEPATHALLHFLWQGSVIALGLGALLALTRPQRAEVRYRWASWALIAMVALPLFTATRYALDEPTRLEHSRLPADGDSNPLSLSTSAKIKNLARALPVADSDSGIAGTLLRQATERVEQPDTARWVVGAWLGGVLLLSLLHLGGWWQVQRLRRIAVTPVPTEWQERANDLCRTLGIKKVVKILRSTAVEVPATIGWLQPVILIPASALTALPVSHLRCILAHELAHVWRRDYVINLIQTSAETLLFYHPAVWWVSGLIRRERENCCDDIAVSLSGDRLSYARALVSFEEIRHASPALALGADGGSLILRVKRLLGGPDMSLQSSRSFLAGTCLALLVLLAGSVLVLAASSELDDAVSVATDAAGADGSETMRGRWFADRQGDWLDLELSRRGRRSHRGGWTTEQRVALKEFKGLAFRDDVEFTLSRDAGTMTFSGIFAGPAERAKGSGRFTFVPNDQYARDLETLGTDDLNHEELMTLAVHDLRSKRVETLRAMGYGPFDSDELMTIAIFDVSPEYIRDLKAHGYENVRLDDLVAMRVHDVNVEYIETMRGAGFRSRSVGDLIAWRVHGVDPEHVEHMREFFGDVPADDLLAMKIHGVTPEYAESLRSIGVRVRSGDDLLAMKIHGVSPGYVKSVRELGYRLDADDLLAWKIHGVDSDFIDGLAELGYENVDGDDLLAMKIHGASPDWIRHVHAKGLDHLDVDDLISLRISGVRF